MFFCRAFKIAGLLVVFLLLGLYSCESQHAVQSGAEYASQASATRQESNTTQAKDESAPTPKRAADVGPTRSGNNKSIAPARVEK